METLQKVCLVITIIGALVWGIIGLFSFNLVDYIFGTGSVMARVIYSWVGVSGLVNIGILLGHIEYKKD